MTMIPEHILAIRELAEAVEKAVEDGALGSNRFEIQKLIDLCDKHRTQVGAGIEQLLGLASELREAVLSVAMNRDQLVTVRVCCAIVVMQQSSASIERMRDSLSSLIPDLAKGD